MIRVQHTCTNGFRGASGLIYIADIPDSRGVRSVKKRFAANGSDRLKMHLSVDAQRFGRQFGNLYSTCFCLAKEPDTWKILAQPGEIKANVMEATSRSLTAMKAVSIGIKQTL